MQYYIFCTYKTDWRSEALHQLCEAIRDFGEQSFIWYTDENMQNRAGIRPLYQDLYNVRTTDKFRLEDIDHANSVWIISDHHTHSFYEAGKNSQRIIWFFDVPGTTKSSINPQDRRLNNYIYLTQTDFVHKQVALVRKNKPTFKITDYIRDHLIEPEEVLTLECKIKQVIYNDLDRGGQYIVPIRSALPDVRFTRISKYSREAIKDLGLKTGVYLDLGRHCHLHRHLREMAVLGSSVIVANLNVATSPTDLQIDNKSLIEVRGTNKDLYTISQEIKDMILEKFYEPGSSFIEGRPLRNQIRNQKQQFYTSVSTLLDYFK